MAVGHSAEAAAAGRMLAASECLTVPDNPDSLTRPGLKLTGSSNKQLFETMPAAALCFGMVQSVGIPTQWGIPKDPRESPRPGSQTA